MAIFWTYLVTALVTALPVIYMTLGAWMGVPVLLTEYFSLLGSVFVLAAAYLSLSFRRVASFAALIGLMGICSFWVIEPIRAIHQGGWSVFLTVLLAAILLACSISAYFAIRDLRRSSVLVSQRFRTGVLSTSGVCFVLIVGAFYWQHKASERHPSYYFIPDGYVGWVKIHHGVPNAPMTPMNAGAYEFRIPASGEDFTNSEQEFGWAHDRYFYVSPNGVQREILETGWGKGGMIWNNSSGTFEEEGKKPDRTEQFFVGTEVQLHQLGENEIESGNLLTPKTGAK